MSHPSKTLPERLRKLPPELAIQELAKCFQCAEAILECLCRCQNGNTGGGTAPPSNCLVPLGLGTLAVPVVGAIGETNLEVPAQNNNSSATLLSIENENGDTLSFNLSFTPQTASQISYQVKQALQAQLDANGGGVVERVYLYYTASAANGTRPLYLEIITTEAATGQRYWHGNFQDQTNRTATTQDNSEYYNHYVAAMVMFNQCENRIQIFDQNMNPPPSEAKLLPPDIETESRYGARTIGLEVI